MSNNNLVIDSIANVHCHFREIAQMGAYIKAGIAGGADVFGPMPNTQEGLTTFRKLQDYILSARKAVPNGSKATFIPIGMITERTSPQELAEFIDGNVHHFKIYPFKRTTKSELHGVKNYYPLIELAKKAEHMTYSANLFFHFHPEHPNLSISNRDAEYLFLPIAEMFLENTRCNIVWEHGTDARCIPFWKKFADDGRFYVTLTAHHLMSNEDLSFGDIRAICKPPIKTETDRQGLLSLVRESPSWLMAGADDAPHPIESKHNFCGPCSCGDYTAPWLALYYAHALDDVLTENSIHSKMVFKRFTSENARKNYGLPRPGTVKIVRKPFKIPTIYKCSSEISVMPFWGGQELNWSFAD